MDHINQLRELLRTGGELSEPAREFFEMMDNASMDNLTESRGNPLPIDPSILLDAFEIARPLSLEASPAEAAIHQVVLLCLTTASAAANMAWDLEEDGKTNI
ncbi:hypothetical protein BN946_scf184399.g5 [Trametes cinnabarina]|uniref:Uncharacterized protein n=1 Tax=Pycnoporus cinnabarinus TaxID=5643 RepID=A0A060SM25_PYCCI|nr:hypothetical protein BN946_scf185009.g22 [Trametes cinnabarina]CDO70187.1 hypothetical protein BN946_scf184774.g15 [Trametes cinnabarina]CDO75445.1 hypothetical protein BN946_scf184693.g14 [Trametes cinnabarina]CDO76535.1 hypothetical protein BN946_scf184399.g5 [Trametes cinnabarina]